MTGALVSGQAHVAFFLEGSQAWCVQPQSPSPEPVSLGLVRYLLEDLAGASYHPEATLASTSELLERACREERGLHLALISMDPTSSETTRELAEDALEEFLEHAYVSEFIENRLFSRRLPDGVPWPEDLVSANFPRVELLKRSVIGAQEAIGRVRSAWDALSDDLFAEPDDRVGFESVLVVTGAFRTLAIAVSEAAKPHSKGDAQVQLLSDRRYETFANSRNILVEWSRSIESASHERAQLVPEERGDDEADRRREKLPKVASYAAFENVIRQKEAILEQLGRRNFQQVERFVDDLVRHQLYNERSDLAAKSLCDLAKGAKDLGFLAYQLAWSSRAREIYPEDPWVHRQFADALLGQHKLPEALEEYEATVRDFPEDAVARRGRAEVLKALGRLPEALEAYQATVRDFPEDVVGHSGKAEVLKALGRLPEALEAYEATVRDFPESVVAQSGRAEVLRALGRLPEALEAYEATVRDFPEDVVARSGKAEVLKALGRLPEALEACEATVHDFPESVVSRSGKAEVLKALGRLPEALEEYEATVRDFPEDVVARNGKATLLVLLGRYEEAAALVGTNQPRTREEWIGLHIRASIKLKQGRLDEADHLFSAGTQCPWAELLTRFIGARALLRIRTRHLKEANAMIRSERSMESKVIQIDIYRRMNKIGEAKAGLREIRECRVAKIVEISRDLERNMKPGKRTVSDDEFLDRELELLLAV